MAERLAGAGIQTSRHLCERLLNHTGVAILPGVDFGMPPESLTARLAYVDFDGAQALEAARNLPPDQVPDQDFVDEFCPRSGQAVERLCNWLEEMR